MPKKNEQTSKRVASVAGRLVKLTAIDIEAAVTLSHLSGITTGPDAYLHNLARDVRLLAASALTQTKDKPRRKQK